MPKKFASWFAPACFAFLLFAAAGSASAQATCDPATDPNQCVVSGGDPGGGPHAIIGGPISDDPNSPGDPGDGFFAILNDDSQSADDFYTFLLMFWGLA